MFPVAAVAVRWSGRPSMETLIQRLKAPNSGANNNDEL